MEGIVSIYKRQLYLNNYDRNPDPHYHEREANRITDELLDKHLHELIERDGRLDWMEMKISEAWERAGDMSKMKSDKMDFYMSALMWGERDRPAKLRLNRKISRLKEGATAQLRLELRS